MRNTIARGDIGHLSTTRFRFRVCYALVYSKCVPLVIKHDKNIFHGRDRAALSLHCRLLREELRMGLTQSSSWGSVRVARGYQIMRVQPNSPASDASVSAYLDFIVGITTPGSAEPVRFVRTGWKLVCQIVCSKLNCKPGKRR